MNDYAPNAGGTVVAEMADFSRNILLILECIGSGWGLSIASLADAESAGDCQMKIRQRFSKSLKDLDRNMPFLICGRRFRESEQSDAQPYSEKIPK